MEEILEPVEIEVEKYTKDDYDRMLQDCYGEVKLGNFTWDADYVIRELDPIAYNVGFNDFQEYITAYLCPICDTEYDDYDEAKWCCQIKNEEE